MKSMALPILMGILLSALPILSQEVTGNLDGTILYSERLPVAGIRIVVSGANLQGTREVTTDERGRFFILALPVGTYAIKIQHADFQEAIIQDVTVRLGKTTSLGEIRLDLKVLEYNIVVSGERPVLDVTTSSGDSNLDVRMVETLPVARDYRSLTALLPHAVQDPYGTEANFAGASGLENKYFVDGVETTDPYTGLIGTRLPYNFVREIEVKTGGYEAEYRSSLGGIVNVITSSGGNEFSGQAFGFYTGNRFSGDPRVGALEPRRGDFSQHDLGISLGGPIVRDRLWFFAAFNPAFEREEVELPGLGFFLDKNSTQTFAGKLTWQAARKTNLVFTMLGDPSERHAVGDALGIFEPYVSLNPDPYLDIIQRGGLNFSLKGTHFFSDRFMIEGTASWINRKNTHLPATETGRNERAFIDAEAGTISGGSAGWNNSISTEITFGLKGIWTCDRHTLKAGMEYRENKLDSDGVYSNITSYSDQRFDDWFFRYGGILKNRIPSLFIQDSWEVSRKFRLNFGLRWDGQFIVAPNGKVCQKILDQYAPRIGIVYQPGGSGSQKVFASLGRNYEDLMLYIFSLYGTDFGGAVSLTYDHDPRVDPSGAEAWIMPNSIQPAIQGLKGQHYDELTLGYERQAGKSFKVGARGILRRLREVVEDSFVTEAGVLVLVMGNPGRGQLAALPRPRREYSALELTLEKFGCRRFNFIASYVLSRNYGNYNGIADLDLFLGMFSPNVGFQFDSPEQMSNSLGLLPNDRTHVFKFAGSYRWAMGLTLGTSILWGSGTPLSEWGGSTLPSEFSLMSPRGSLGRTPAIFDVNFRLMLELAKAGKISWLPRIFLDVFHVGSRRTPIGYDQIHYRKLDADGNQIYPNPTYGAAIRFFPPMSARLGLEMRF
jgi:hypothetical protein